MIFYSYTINALKKTILLVSNTLSSSDILSSKFGNSSSTKDLHVFAVPESIYPDLDGKGTPIETLIHKIFPLTFGPRLLQTFQSMDLAALSLEIVREEKMSTPISPPTESKLGFKHRTTHLVCLPLDKIIPYISDIEPPKSNEIFKTPDKQILPVNLGFR